MQWIEMGPGRGVLMADAWRAAGLSPAFRAAARVTLVEPSAPLRAVQAERLAAASPMQVETLEAAPPGPTLLIANEVLDCLPVRQFVRTPRGWCERMVGLGPDGALTFGLFPAPSEVDAPNLPEGAVFEVAPGLPALIGALAARLHAAPGRALLIDYGYTAQEGADTLQALRRHEKRPPLAEPGEADLTALVDFSAVARLARAAGLRVDGPTPQGAFLHALGIAERAEALARAAPGSRETIARAYNRLTAPDQMGALFQAICLSSPNLPPAAGL
jgi:NADH dehydrogenase [ubiquinone] 1 alpha subcomplex assembly factor 7